MFHQARIKLTAFYLAIIMLISISFSGVIYRVLTSELNRVARIQGSRAGNFLPHPPAIDEDLVRETKDRLILFLTVVNIIILGTSAVSGYFLAGKTLDPISKMLDEQKRFVSDASHELKTPLTSIKTEIEVALRDRNLNLENAKELLKSNIDEVNKMQKLTNYLLELNRFQSGNGNLSFSRINLKVVLKKAIEKIEKLAEAKNIKITKKLQNTSVSGNEESLVELAVILLDNAVKYSPQGKEIIVRTVKTTTAGIMEFKDSGVGIKKEDLPHIFERFYRADTSRSKEKTDGYGLGLSIADGIAKLNNGSIKVESKEGKGSTFTVRI